MALSEDEVLILIRIAEQGAANLDKTKAQLGSLSAEADASGAAMAGGLGKADKAAEEMAQSGNLQKVDRDLNTLGSDAQVATSKVTKGANASSHSLHGMAKAFDDVAKHTSSIPIVGTMMKDMADKMENADQAGSGLMGGMLKLGAITGLVGVGSLVAFSAASVKAASDFESSMTTLVTGAGESQKNIKMVGDGILNMAGQVGQSTTSLAQGMYLVESAGYHGAAGLAVLKASAEGAATGNADLATVAGGVTTVLKQYNLGASSATAVTSGLIQTVADGKTTLGDLSSALASVLPVAAQAGVGYAQVGGALATMTAGGTTARRASTQLAFLLRALISPSTAATQAMADMGLNSVTVSKNLGKEGLTGTLGELTSAITAHMGPAGLVLEKTFTQSQTAAGDLQTMLKAMPASVQVLAQQLEAGSLGAKDYGSAIADLPAGQKELGTQFLATYDKAHSFNAELAAGGPAAQTYVATLQSMVGGANGLSAALDLTGNHLSTYKSNVDNISSAMANGKTQVQGFKLVQGDLSFQLDQAKDTVEALSIKFGEVLIPVLEQVGIDIGNLITWFEKHKTVAEALAVVIGTVLVGAIGTFVGEMVGSFVGAVQGAITSLLRLVGIMPEVEASEIAAGEASDDMFGPVGLAIGLLLPLLIELVTHWKQVREELEKHKAAVIAVAAAITILLGPIGLMIAALAGLVVGIIYVWTHWHQIWGWIKNEAEEVWHYLDGVWHAIETAANDIWAAIIAVIHGHWAKALADVKAAWDAIKGYLDQVWGLIKSAAMAVWGAIGGYLETAWNAVKNTAISVWGSILAWLTGAWNTIKSTAFSIWGSIVSWLTGAWDAVKNEAISVWDSILSFLTTTWDNMKSDAMAIFNLVVSFLSGVWNMIQADATIIWNGIKAYFSLVWNTIVDVFKDVSPVGIIMSHWTAIKADAISVWNAIKAFLSSVWDAMVGLARTQFGLLTALIIGVPKKIMSVFAGAATWLISAGEQVIEGLIKGILSQAGNVVSAVKGIAGDVTHGVLGAFGIKSPSTVFAEQVGKPIMQGWALGITNNAHLASDAVTKAAAGLTSAAASGALGGTSMGSSTGAESTKLALSSIVTYLSEFEDLFKRILSEVTVSANKSFDLSTQGGALTVNLPVTTFTAMLTAETAQQATLNQIETAVASSASSLAQIVTMGRETTSSGGGGSGGAAVKAAVQTASTKVVAEITKARQASGQLSVQALGAASRQIFWTARASKLAEDTAKAHTNEIKALEKSIKDNGGAGYAKYEASLKAASEKATKARNEAMAKTAAAAEAKVAQQIAAEKTTAAKTTQAAAALDDIKTHVKSVLAAQTAKQLAATIAAEWRSSAAILVQGIVAKEHLHPVKAAAGLAGNLVTALKGMALTPGIPQITPEQAAADRAAIRNLPAQLAAEQNTATHTAAARASLAQINTHVAAMEKNFTAKQLAATIALIKNPWLGVKTLPPMSAAAAAADKAAARALPAQLAAEQSTAQHTAAAKSSLAQINLHVQAVEKNWTAKQLAAQIAVIMNPWLAVKTLPPMSPAAEAADRAAARALPAQLAAEQNTAAHTAAAKASLAQINQHVAAVEKNWTAKELAATIAQIMHPSTAPTELAGIHRAMTKVDADIITAFGKSLGISTKHLSVGQQSYTSQTAYASTSTSSNDDQTTLLRQILAILRTSNGYEGTTAKGMTQLIDDLPKTVTGAIHKNNSKLAAVLPRAKTT
jgi:phage-related protein